MDGFRRVESSETPVRGPQFVGLMCNPGREVRRKDFGWEYEQGGE
jgi:hypothetical protein